MQRRRLTILCAVVLGTPSAPIATGQWLEEFDRYQLGPLAAQSDWEEWTGSSGVDADVVAARAFTQPHALLIHAGGEDSGDDVVYDFARLPDGAPTSGRWVFGARLYVGQDALGSGFVILLNDYPNPNWSMQVRIDATNDKVQNDGIDFGELPLVRGLWVPVQALIDLDADRMDLYYGGEALVRDASWTNGMGGSGRKQIAAVDLFSGNEVSGIKSLYVDQVQLEETFGPPLLLTVGPNPVRGQTIVLRAAGQGYAQGTHGYLYSWTFNDSLFVQPLLRFRFDQNGEWELQATVPPGLDGVDLGLRALALVPGEPLSISNTELVLFR